METSNTKWYYTPTTKHADLTALGTLPPTTIAISRHAPDRALEPALSEARQVEEVIEVENTGRSLAFQVHLKLVDPAKGNEILPVFWAENYFQLMPGERKQIRVGYPRGDARQSPRIEADAWNVARLQLDR